MKDYREESYDRMTINEDAIGKNNVAKWLDTVL
jgi:hypothetical protein